MINPDRLTVKAAEALNSAVADARRAGNPVVYDLHLLVALLAQDEGIVVPVLQKLGANVTALREQAAREIGRLPKQSDAQPNVSRELSSVFDKAEDEAKALGDEYVSTEHLLLALSDAKGTESKRILNAAGATRAALLDGAEPRCAARTASPTRRRRTSTRRCSATRATSPTRRARASSIRSSAATRRSAASCRCCRAAPRTTRCSSASRASARRRSSKGSRSAS